MATKTLVNGIETSLLSCNDRGLHYGDGLFETILVQEGSPMLWDEHISRMAQGCKQLGMYPPPWKTLEHEANQLCLGSSKAVLKILLTRGVSGRGYRFHSQHEAPKLTRILQLYGYPDYPIINWSQGINLVLCKTKVGCHPQLAGIKHLNRLENILARNEWNDESIAEGVMTDHAGNWIEGTMSNVFIVSDGKLYTPDLSHCGIKGIMRQHIIQLAEEIDIPCQIQTVSTQFALNADEIFVTNSLIGLWPVKNFEGKFYTNWPISTQLRQSLLSS